MEKFDKKTEKWFKNMPEGTQTTVMTCEKCGLSYKPSLGHNCKFEKTPKSCPFCHEDKEGCIKMLGAFSLHNPFNAGTWYLTCGKAKPCEIKFCPVCGRNLTQDRRKKDER